MSKILRAVIVYGILVDNDNLPLLPWYKDEYDYDIEYWWQEINDLDSNYIYSNIPKNYNDYKDNWERNNPLPIKVKYILDENYPSVILRSPDSFFLQTDSFDVLELNMNPLVHFDGNIYNDSEFINFCTKYLSNLDLTQKFYLAPYYS